MFRRKMVPNTAAAGEGEETATSPKPKSPKKKVPEKKKAPPASTTVEKKKVPPKKVPPPKKKSPNESGAGAGGSGGEDTEQECATAVSKRTSYAGGPNSFENDKYDPSKWRVYEYKFQGKATSEHMGKLQEVKGKHIKDGIEHFKKNPKTLICMMYQTNMVNFVEPKQKYHYLHRQDTYLYKPRGVTKDPKAGWMTLLMNKYEHLPPFPNDELPMKFRDAYTDDFEFLGRKLHSPDNKPYMPGRGMGIGDFPGLKIIGNVDPSDVHQGTIGDCWLLGAISAVCLCIELMAGR
jgi:hypothetical protein